MSHDDLAVGAATRVNTAQTHAACRTSHAEIVFSGGLEGRENGRVIRDAAF